MRHRNTQMSNRNSADDVDLTHLNDGSTASTRSLHSSTMSISSSKARNSIHEVPTLWAFALLACLCVLFGGVYWLDDTLPRPYYTGEEDLYPNEFIAERAQTILKGLAEIGPKVVGSKANEILAVNYLHNQIDNILKSAHNSFKITKSHQVTNGSYFLGFHPNGFVNVYRNVQNIIVKVDGRNGNDSILINAHFDSVPTSPGASDDGIMVAVMLETLRKLTQVERQYERDIIFLFNGDEESPLQASHGFITQHEWATSCGMIINLEAGGHGGRAIMFQSGPNHSPALMTHYTKVPYPYAQAAGEEIFQSNLVPSDTDFRIFRDFGNLSGFDIAFAQNGYRYHTKYDSFNDLPLGSYQHAGSNLLTLVKSLATDPNSLTDNDEKVVYFDVFNWFMISYSMLVAYIVNIVVALTSLSVAILSAKKLQLGLNKSSLLYITYTTLTIIGSWIISAGLALLIGFILDVFNKTMSWYGSPCIVLGLYVAPIVGTFTGVMWIFNRYGPHKGKTLGTQSQIQMHIIRLIWTFVLFIGTLLKIRSVYVILLAVLFNTVASIIILAARWQHSARKWILCAILFTLIPVILMMYLSVEIYSLFIPITGRMGANRNPEFLIGMLTVLMTLLIASNYTSFSVLVRQQILIPFVLFFAFLITSIVVLTSFVFPYSADQNAPTPQRFMIYHTNRVHHDAHGVVSEQSGIFLFNMDRNSPQTVEFAIGDDLYNISSDCEKYPACGMPISSPRMLQAVDASSWKAFNRAIINESVSMNYTTKLLSANVKQYSFIIECPDHTTVFIRPHNGTKILRTSLDAMETTELLFINFVYGKAKANLEFTLDIHVEEEKIDKSCMDFVVSGKYYNFNGSEYMTQEFSKFVNSFPPWADVVPALANYESFVI